jgi:SAM-dependent methyltransferase
MSDSTSPAAAALTVPPETALVAFGKSIAFRPGFEWVEACDLCGASEFEERAVYPEYLLFTGEWFRLVRCKACSLHFVNPRPGPEIIGEYYPTDYLAHMNEPRPLRSWQKRAGGKDARAPGPLGRLGLHVRQSMHWYFIPPFENGGRFLDVGCGAGKLLDTLKMLGWDTYGVEVAPSAVERACAKGHQVVVGTAESQAHEPASFDALSMWHVLEHTHSPARAIANAYQNLKPGGRYYIAIPNFKSFHARLFGKYWWSSDAPRHLFQFDETTIRSYLEKAGFKDIEMTTRTGASSWLRGFRHTINGWFGSKLESDPAWILEVCELPVVASSLFKFFGMGSELRVSCRK